MNATGWAAVALALALAAANAEVALQVHRAGGGLDAALAGQGAALLAGAVWLAAERSARAGLALTVLSLWVYWGMAPVIGQVLTGPPSELPIWLGPVEIVAFAFFPVAFFAWRGLVRAEAEGGDAG